MSLVDDVQSFNMAVQAMDTEMHALSEEMDAEFERSFVNIRPQAENAQFIAGTNEAQFRDNSQILTNKILTGVDKCCELDVAILRFRFNEISAKTKSFLRTYPEAECKDLRDTVLLLQKAVLNLGSKLRLTHLIGEEGFHPRVYFASTPRRQDPRF